MQTERAYHGTAYCHKQRSGDTLAAHIGYHQSNAVVVDAEEVVEVAADVLRRLHRGIDVQLVADLGEGRELLWQDELLDFLGRNQFFLQSCQLLVFLLRLTHEINLTDGFLDGAGEIVHINRLRGKVEGSVVHGLTDVLHVTVGTHHDDALGWVLHLIHLGQHGQTVHLRHVDVTEDDIDVRMVVQHREAFHTVMRKEELIFATAQLPSEILLHQEFNLFLVVNT